MSQWRMLHVGTSCYCNYQEHCISLTEHNESCSVLVKFNSLVLALRNNFFRQRNEITLITMVLGLFGGFFCIPNDCDGMMQRLRTREPLAFHRAPNE